MNRTIGQCGTGAVAFSLLVSGSVPVYRQIITQIEHGVLSGRLKAGDRLPTIRALAVELKINPNTIAKAYSELEIRGLLVKRTGSGTFICDQKPPGADEAREEKIRQIVGRFLREMGELGVERDAVIECIKAVPKFHFLEQPQKMKENIQHEKNEFGLYSKCAETQTE